MPKVDRSLPMLSTSSTRERVIFAVWFLSATIVVYGSLTPLPMTPPDVPFADKLLHFLAYCWLAALPMFLQRRAWGIIAPPLAVMALGIVLEIGQLYVPGRTFSLGDMAANGAGVLAGTISGNILKPWIGGR